MLQRSLLFSILSMGWGGGLIEREREGALLQNLTAKAGLLERELNRAFAVYNKYKCIGTISQSVFSY